MYPLDAIIKVYAKYKFMISCSEYDYIEIVCLYRYRVRLTMKTGEIIDGIALDTKSNERLLLNINGLETLVDLNNISKLEVKVNNPHFTEVTFN